MFGLSRSTVFKIHEVFARYPEIERVIIYGSRAKGTNSVGSDIDLTLITKTELPYQRLLLLQAELDDLNLPYQIDLSVFRELNNPELIDHIKRVGVSFYPFVDAGAEGGEIV